jgi:hypothetical protein
MLAYESRRGTFGIFSFLFFLSRSTKPIVACYMIVIAFFFFSIVLLEYEGVTLAMVVRARHMFCIYCGWRWDRALEPRCYYFRVSSWIR